MTVLPPFRLAAVLLVPLLSILFCGLTVSAADSPSPTSPIPTQVAHISQIEQRAQPAHPLTDPQFPLRVRIMVGKEERKGVFRDGEMRVPLGERALGTELGDEYQTQTEMYRGDTIPGPLRHGTLSWGTLIFANEH